MNRKTKNWHDEPHIHKPASHTAPISKTIMLEIRCFWSKKLTSAIVFICQIWHFIHISSLHSFLSFFAVAGYLFRKEPFGVSSYPLSSLLWYENFQFTFFRFLWHMVIMGSLFCLCFHRQIRSYLGWLLRRFSGWIIQQQKIVQNISLQGRMNTRWVTR